MSKAKIAETNSLHVSPAEVVALAEKHNVKSIAYTYNDPTIFGEYVIDISKIARERNIRSVMVTAGYIDKNARKDVYRYIDAANVDLKAFTDLFYKKLTFSSLSDVLDTLLWIKNETDIWLEITTLLIPGENDSPEETGKLSRWIKENLGADVPLHFTAFHPDFKMKHIPQTPLSTLNRARKIALREGIRYCYLGNVWDDEGHMTRCPECNAPLVERDWHSVRKYNLKGNKCPECGETISGHFD